MADFESNDGASMQHGQPQDEPVQESQAQDIEAQDIEVQDRRTEGRTVSVLINAGVAHNGRDGLCRIRNISHGGVMIETRLPLQHDAGVAIQLRSGREIIGLVRWCEGNVAGIALVDADADTILNDHAQFDSRSTQLALPRFERSAPVDLTVHHRRHRCVVTSISLADMTVAGLTDAIADDVVMATIQGLDARLATIVERIDDEAHIAFTQPLPFRLLEHWLDANIADAQAPSSSAA